MKNHFFYSVILISMGLANFSPLSAQTLSNDRALLVKIENVKPISYVEMEALFSKNPVYETRCYPDSGNQVAPDSEELQVFSETLAMDSDGEIHFELIKMDEGFDIQVERQLKIGPNIQEANPFQFVSSASCFVGLTSEEEAGAANESGDCSGIKVENTLKFSSPIQDDSYESLGEKQESWEFYIESPETIYAKKNVDLTIRELNMWGAPSNYVRISKNSVCRLSLKSFSLDL